MVISIVFIGGLILGVVIGLSVASGNIEEPK